MKRGYKPDLIEAGGWDKESTLTLDDYIFKSSHKVPPGVRLVGGQSTKWFGRVSLFPKNAYVNRSEISGHEWPFPYADIEKSYLEVCNLIQIEDQADRKSLVHQCDNCRDLVDTVFFDFLQDPNMFKNILKEMAQRNEIFLHSSTYCSNLLDVAGGVLVTTISTESGLFEVKRDLYDDVFICCGTLDSTRLVLSSFPELKQNTSAGKFLMDHLDGYVGEIKIRPSDYQCIKEFYLNGTRRLPDQDFGLGIYNPTDYINWHLEVVPLVRVYLFDPVVKRFSNLPRFVYEALFLLERLITFIPNRLSHIKTKLDKCDVYSLWLRAEEFPNVESTLELGSVNTETSIPTLIYEHRVSADSLKTIQRTLRNFTKSIYLANLGKIKVYWWLRIPGIFNLGGNNHPMGTLSTGLTDRFPVDQKLRLKVAPKVRVVSSAVFPSGGHQNPTSLAMSLAIIAAKAFPEK